MGKFLLIDFGASRIKSAVADWATGFISQVSVEPSLSNIASHPQRFEISAEGLLRQFSKIAEGHLEREQNLDGILLTSQMHGFVLLDEFNHRVSEYVSWKDERSLEGENQADTAFTVLEKTVGEDFRKITGMKPRPSFPYFNAVALAKTLGLKQAKLLSLPEWLAHSGWGVTGTVHPTMSLGSGFFELETGKPSALLLSAARDFSGCEFSFNETLSNPDVWVTSRLPAGGQKSIPVFVGVGDHQCAVLGAGNLPQGTISMNVGTGSQVSVIDGEEKSVDIEERPYFSDRQLKTITHIPAGRVLDYYLEVLAQKNPGLDFWEILEGLQFDEIWEAEGDINLAIFPGAWGYDMEKTAAELPSGFPQKILASLVKSLINQYVKAIETIDPERKIRQIILSGGLARKLPKFPELLERLSGREVKPPSPFDETLLGLDFLAAQISK